MNKNIEINAGNNQETGRYANDDSNNSNIKFADTMNRKMLVWDKHNNEKSIK